ncbi:MAG: hypothetical protein IJS17_02965 [Clostridia bacterium]|nr:hypothetical protein [Clostridia bacterium]
MKTYEEIANDVFRKGDRYLAQRKINKRKRIKLVTLTMATVLCVAVLGAANKIFVNKTDVVSPETAVTTVLANEKNNSKKTSEPESQDEKTNADPENEKDDPTTQLQSQDIFHPTTKPNEVTYPSDPVAAASSMSSEVLKNAIENNTCGWVKVDGKYFVEDDWSSAYGVKTGEKAGHSSAVEGNLEALGIVGEIYYLDDENYQGCLMVKSKTARDIIFVPIP